MARQPLRYQLTLIRQLVAGQWVTTKISFSARRRNAVQSGRITRLSTYATRAGWPFDSDIQERTSFTDQEMQIFAAVVRAERISRGLLIPCAFIDECELNFRFNHATVSGLIDRGFLIRWARPEWGPAVTLTPICAHVLGLRLGEIAIRWYQDEVQEVGNWYRGTRRKKIKILRYDYEPFWIGASTPERRHQRSLPNPLERPLDRHINEIEDKLARRYVKELGTMTFTDDVSEAARILDVPVSPLRRPGRKAGEAGRAGR